MRFGVLKTPTAPLPLFKAAWCPNAADKVCINFVESSQVDVLLDFFMQIECDISVPLKTY